MTFETFTAPAYWACYLINGDASGMKDNEIKQADDWQRSNNIHIIDVVRDETGEAEEPRFSGDVPFYAPQVDFKGGDVIDYVCELLK